MVLLGQGIVDDGLKRAADGGHKVGRCVVFHHRDCMPQSEVPWTEDRDTWWHEAVEHQPASCDVTWLDAEAPLFKVGISLLCDSGPFLVGDRLLSVCGVVGCSTMVLTCCEVAVSLAMVTASIAVCFNQLDSAPYCIYLSSQPQLRCRASKGSHVAALKSAECIIAVC